MIITINQIMDLEPCKLRDEILALSGGRKSFEALDMLRSDTVSARDKLWVGIRFLPPHQARLYACDVAGHVAHLDPSGVATQTVAVIQRYINGVATSEELYAAEKAARAWVKWETVSAAAMWAAAEAAIAADEMSTSVSIAMTTTMVMSMATLVSWIQSEEQNWQVARLREYYEAAKG